MVDSGEDAPRTWPSRFVLCTVPTKVLLYGSHRLVYMLLSFLAVDWGLSRAEMGYVLAAGDFAGVLAGLIPTLADEHGNRPVAIVSYVACLLMSLAMLAPPTLLGLIVVRFVLVASTLVYIVASQSSLQAIQGRGAAACITGLSEAGRPLSSIVFVPLLSMVYSYLGWRAMFGVIAGLFGVFVVEVVIDYPTRAEEEECIANDPARAQSQKKDPSAEGAPPEGRGISFRKDQSEAPGSRFGALRGLRRTRYWAVLAQPGPVLFNLSTMLYEVPYNMLFVGFLVWAEEEQGLSPEEVGTASIGLGVFELLGSLFVIALGDRLGVYRSLFGAIMLSMALAPALSGLCSLGLVSGIVGIGLLRMLGTVATTAPKALSERYVEPDLRTTMLGLNFMSHFVARAFGALLAEVVWTWNKLPGMAIVSPGLVGLSLLLLHLSARFLLGADADAGRGRPAAESDESTENSESEVAESHGAQPEGSAVAMV